GVVNVTGQANISCSITSNNLVCTAAGGSVTIGATTGAFGVQFSATPSAAGTFANPRAGGACSVDPGTVITESAEGNNTCSDSVSVATPDLTIIKSNNAGGNGTVGNPWNWTVTVANTGTAPATFTAGQTILSDNLPDTNIAYGATSIVGVVNVTGQANISCSITSNNLVCTASGGSVTIGATTGAFGVQFSATPSAAGTFANPRAGGACSVDPGTVVTESAEGNNTCTDSVSVATPDLTATKTNNVGGSTTLGNNWNWTVTVANTGAAPAVFTAGQTILADNLPNTNIGYGATSIVGVVNVTGQANIACSIVTSNLVCTASGGSVTIGATTGTFGVQFTATPTAAGAFANPRAGGACSVDPGTVITESAEGNNTCGDSVSVTAPELTATKTNNVGGATTTGNNWTWTIAIANTGNGPATFTAGQTILSDSLPSTNIGYGAASVVNVVNVTGQANISCVTSPSSVVCTAAGGPVTIGATTGTFGVQFTATPAATGSFVNPTGGVCAVDPNGNVTETNDGNNGCSDTVNVTAGGNPALSGNITAKSGPSNARVWTVRIDNAGPGTAVNAQINGLTLTQTFGVACTPVVSAPFPLALGSINPAAFATGNITIDFTGCAVNARFTATVPFSSNSGAVTGTIIRYNQFQ
ncbi:MAG: beta strand repeat-containing protein, partial [Bryobacteraceae bacterium]